LAPDGLGVFDALAAVDALADGVIAGAAVAAGIVAPGVCVAPLLELVVVVLAAAGVGAAAWGATAPESLADVMLEVASLESEQPQTRERPIDMAARLTRR
jgi:hypothetical protein